MAQANGLTRPVCTGPGTVTMPIETTFSLQRSDTLTMRIGIHQRRGASRGTVTRFTQATFDLRIGVGIISGTGARYQSTGFTGSITNSSTAIAVHAQPRQTLRRVTARLAIRLANDADAAVAPCVVRTMVIGDAVFIASPVAVADIGVAGRLAAVQACAQSVAKIGIVLNVVLARLRVAYGARQPIAARPGAITTAVQQTGVLPVLTAIVHRVNACKNKLAAARPVAHLAQPTIVVRVRVVGDIAAGALGAHLVAKLARAVARRVAAIAVHAEARQAVVGVATCRTVGLLWLADAVVAMSVVIAISVSGARGRTNRGSLLGPTVAIDVLIIAALVGQHGVTAPGIVVHRVRQA